MARENHVHELMVVYSKMLYAGQGKMSDGYTMNFRCATCNATWTAETVTRLLNDNGQYPPLENLRPVLRAFAVCMEQRLRDNDWKGGWHNSDPQWLIVKLIEEVGELANLIANGETVGKVGVCGEAADVANMAMMIADRLGKLKY